MANPKVDLQQMHIKQCRSLMPAQGLGRANQCLRFKQQKSAFCSAGEGAINSACACHYLPWRLPDGDVNLKGSRVHMKTCQLGFCQGACCLPEGNVGHEGNVAIGVDGSAVASHHCAAIHVGVDDDPEVRSAGVHRAHPGNHGRLVLRVRHMVGEPAVGVQELAA